MSEQVGISADVEARDLIKVGRGRLSVAPNRREQLQTQRIAVRKALEARPVLGLLPRHLEVARRVHDARAVGAQRGKEPAELVQPRAERL